MEHYKEFDLLPLFPTDPAQSYPALRLGVGLRSSSSSSSKCWTSMAHFGGHLSERGWGLCSVCLVRLTQPLQRPPFAFRVPPVWVTSCVRQQHSVWWSESQPRETCCCGWGQGWEVGGSLKTPLPLTVWSYLKTSHMLTFTFFPCVCGGALQNCLLYTVCFEWRSDWHMLWLIEPVLTGTSR